MSIQNKEKLNQLYRLLPEGAVVSSRWLQEKGYSCQLIFKYARAGWLNSVGRGAYCRPTTQVNWMGLIASWQNVDKGTFHVGGETALNLQGFAHYLKFSSEGQIYLFGHSAVPAWVKQVALKESLRFKSGCISDKSKNILGLTEIPSAINGWMLKISGPERAILETLEEVQDEFTFTFAAELMEGLTTLRPKLVNQLLQLCGNIRVKRLFMFMAKYYNHTWVKQISEKTVALGSGKRVVVQNGKLDKEYLITVPRAFHDRSK
ncbi:MAG: type IV toxin-antitoxin system AbiEi family antitoxin [Candidatus Omnitrophica bacterium]|nr:type IV toxin-antitoxin system AbiEi family antitoxin [Candidatus Omnitrophota bacterium]